VDLLVEDRKVRAQFLPINCFTGTHFKKFDHR
jgi:hypothetical protein